MKTELGAPWILTQSMCIYHNAYHECFVPSLYNLEGSKLERQKYTG